MAVVDDIALYALGYWSHEHHPFRIDALCLNTIQRKTPCAACTDACPEGIVLDHGKINWASCTNCNLCVTACPTAAINQSSTSFSNIRQAILEGDAPVSFACEHCEEHADVRCVCLASIPWDLVAAAALGPGAVFKAHVCKDCPRGSFVAQVKETVRTLQRFLGKERFGQFVSMHDDPDALRSSGADKRLVFERFAGGVAQGAETALGGSEKPTMSCYRALLLEVLQERNGKTAEPDEAVEVSWLTFDEGGMCRACEICTKMCPHDALTLVDPGLEGQRLVHDASKCTQCGLCYVSCPADNLGDWVCLETSEVPACTSWPIDVSLCEKCGRPFKPDEEGQARCIACMRKQFAPPAVGKS